MQKKCFGRIILILTLLAVALLTVSCKDGKEKKKDNKQIVLTTGFEENELFRINDCKCYLPEAKVYIRTLATNYDSLYGPDIMNVRVNDMKVEDKLNSVAMSRLATVKAMVLLAADRGITLTERDEARCANAAETFINSLSPADRRDLGVDKELVTSMYRDYALSNKVYEDITGDINPEISDDEARIITIKRILIKSTDQANAMQIADSLRSVAMEGSDFDTLVDEYNEGEESVYSFGKDTSLFPTEFVDACFALSTGDISGVIVTDEGCSVVKCLSSFDMEETDANKERIVKERKNKAFEDIYSAFVKDLITSFNQELWNVSQLNDKPLDSKDNFFLIYDDIFSI